jgi:hypothetical protein
MNRITRLNPALRGDIEEIMLGHARTPLTQRQIDALPGDRRERDGEAFDIPIRFGDGMRWGGYEKQPRDRADIVGDVIGALIVVGVAAFVAWMAARGMGGIRWR